MIDYEHYCGRMTAFLAGKPHARLLETLVVELAVLSFREWPALDALTIALHKPKIREGTRRIGVELDWTRADYDAWRVHAQAAAAVAAR
jgi:dihydroneopterin aldolase